MRRLNNKITPSPNKLKLTDSKEEVIGYGSHSCSSIRGWGKKATYVCPNIDCHYSSRLWNTASFKTKELSVSSFNCPHHNKRLVFLGDASELPKIGARRKKFLKLLLC